METKVPQRTALCMYQTRFPPDATNRLRQLSPPQSAWYHPPNASCYRHRRTVPPRTLPCCHWWVLAQTPGKAPPWHWSSYDNGSIWSSPRFCGSSSRRHFATCAHQWSMHSLLEWHICDPVWLRWLNYGKQAFQTPTAWRPITDSVLVWESLLDRSHMCTHSRAQSKYAEVN